MTEFLKQTLKDIEARRRELEPLVEEYRQLEEAAAALAGVNSQSGRSSRGGSTATRRPRSTTRSSAGAGAGRSGGAGAGTRRGSGASTRRGSDASTRRGRPRGSGKRAQQALKLVTSQPGITIPELAKAMKIQPNYLYRVMPTLEGEGKVTRKDKGWYPA